MIQLPAIILCGGLGTRLRPVVNDRPKALAEVNGRPFLDHLLDHLERQGVRDVYLSTGHLGEHLEEFVARSSRDRMTVRCVREPDPLGTGGAVRFVRESAYVEPPFLVLNGDTFFSGDLSRLARLHADSKAAATLAAVRVEEPERYGTVRLAPDHAVVSFEEKGSASGSQWINAGVYLVEADLVQSIPAGRPVSIEREVFPEWVGRGLFGCPYPDAEFLDIGTPEDYHRAELLLR